MRYEAVVFDFFGTLSYPVTLENQQRAVAPMAEAMGVALDAVLSALQASFTDRCLGRWGSYEQTMARLAVEVDVTLSEEALAELCRIRLSGQQAELIRVRSDAEPVVRTLREAGLKIGLLTDCTHELAMTWADLPIARHFDATVFSVETGTKKPDPAIFASAAERLGVRPDQCLYIGDGGSNELTGASQVGMTAVLLDDPDGRGAIVYDRDRWDGAAIGTLRDVPSLAHGAES